ncbi:hypothetical protein N7495_004136 [Penicillium taxi]|uniref:uncharacterized protein n=1 Tax=Penicillium taxi TaxID=168475 RepID=UPI0025451D30|nr:uncharacterized protein N7495_004136 [Penicillium taxi]KAJ5899392.1 hypothetical protein N7495_004136 [Penicillium taxi]
MSRYAEAHANAQGAGDARPTALQIVKDEEMDGKLTGKVAVITGVSSGIGIETARAIAATGARLFLTARNLDKAKKALEEFFDPTQMELVEMDQLSFDSVRAAAKTILSKTDQITLLVNNAAIMAVQDLQLTELGHEVQFATNHLSHFLFFNLLKPALLAGSSPKFQSRVVVVSSAGHRVQPLNSPDNYHFQKGNYTAWGSYSQSKVAGIHMANEIERRYGSSGLHALSLNPGIIATNLGYYLPEEEIQAMLSNPFILKVQKSIEQGASTTLWAAVSRELEGEGGLYLDNCSIAERAEDGDTLTPGKYASYAFNSEADAQLWKDSLNMVSLPSEK